MVACLRPDLGLGLCVCLGLGLCVHLLVLVFVLVFVLVLVLVLELVLVQFDRVCFQASLHGGVSKTGSASDFMSSYSPSTSPLPRTGPTEIIEENNNEMDT